jgi:hypothetical protein
MRNRELWREWYEGSYLDTEHWHEVQRVVYARNGGRCERCDRNDMEHVHHVHYFSIWHELEDPTSVIGVCADCHAYLGNRSSHDPAAEEPCVAEETPHPDCEQCGMPAEVELEGTPLCRECYAKIVSP